MVTGIIFSLLEEAVTRRYGRTAWPRMLAHVDASGFLPFDQYRDGDLFALLEALPVPPETPASDRLRWFGRAVVPLVAERYPMIFAPHSSTESFLLALNEVLHSGVHRLTSNPARWTSTCWPAAWEAASYSNTAQREVGVPWPRASSPARRTTTGSG